jgi:hypothetical protein
VEQSLALVELRVFLRMSGRVVCYCPDVPQAFRDSIADTGIEYVRGVEQSGNTTGALRLSAAMLGERRFVPQRAEMLDALPNLRPGLLDAWRMNLNLSDRFEWRKFRKELRLPSDVPSRPATARAVVDSLRQGAKDVLLVVAHNDGTYIYMPSGERLAFKDIAALKRETPPDRIVVLVTCKGASPQEGLKSLAAMLLENRLAKSVFASSDFIDARKLPEMLDRLSSSPSLRSALKEFQFEQYVENAHEYRPHDFFAPPWFLRPRLPRV